MRIYGFQKLTLLDYPEHLAASIFLGGCNLRCPFCHNEDLVLNYSSMSPILEEDIFKILNKRKSILEGICITGGEPTLYDDLPDLIEKIKSLGFKVKLDTNGNNPWMIQYLLEENLVDYIAMDIKNSLSSYPKTVGIKDFDTANIKTSASLIMTSSTPYEFRTTVVKEFHNKADFRSIGKWLQGASCYYLQSFSNRGNLLSNGLHAYDKNDLLAFRAILKTFIPNVFLRGIDE